MTVMICCGVTPCLGVSMTSTSVVFGIAAMGTPEAPPDCDWATDDAGIAEFIGLSFLDSVWFVQSKKITNRTVLIWYQLVPHVYLDAAAYRWFQINSDWPCSPRVVVVPLGTIYLQWYYMVPGVVGTG